MRVCLLDSELYFPPANRANKDGILAVGGDLSPERLLLAYQNGIFPWYSPGDPILWWHPDPRCVLYLDELKVSKSMRNVLNRGDFRCTFDRCFDQVLENCASVKRSDDGTWINQDMQRAYLQLHKLGVAHSVEVWQGGELVGGLYGLSLGHMFFGESMFSLKSNASKAAFVFLVRQLQKLNFKMIDCQVTNSHLISLGACEIPRDKFLKELEGAMKFETLKGDWGALQGGA